jgi:hypothetical protein
MEKPSFRETGIARKCLATLLPCALFRAGTCTGITIAADKRSLQSKRPAEAGLFLFGMNVIPGRAEREPGISTFPDVQLHI